MASSNYFSANVSAIPIYTALCYDGRAKFSIWCKDNNPTGPVCEFGATVTAKNYCLDIIIAVIRGNIFVGRGVGFLDRWVTHGK